MPPRAPDRRLSRKQRLTDGRLFEEAFAGGLKYAGRYVVLWLRRGPDAAQRLGVVAARRTFRRAVDRARAKRLMREAYRLNRFRLRNDGDVVLLARAAILRARRQDVEEDLLRVAQRAGILAVRPGSPDQGR